MSGVKGQQLKSKVLFRERLNRYLKTKRVDPWYFMAQCIADESMVERIAADGTVVLVPAVSLEHKIQCAKELAQYLQPKLRSVELSTDPESPLQILQALPQEQFDELLHHRLREAGYGPIAMDVLG